ncbi:MAG: Bax inhibitor-1/YccA family protein [Actinomycetes bacterium]
MESRNPVIRRYADFQQPGSVLNNRGGNDSSILTSTPVEQTQERTFPGVTPAKPGERVVTMDDVVMKSFVMLGLLLVGAFVGWNAPGLAIMAAIAGLVLGLVNTFKKNVSPALVIAYALMQGVFVGGISYIYQNLIVADGTNIVGNTIMSTIVAFGTMLFLFRSGIIKVDAKFTRMMMVAMISYLVIAVISLIAAFMGVGNGWGFYGVGGIGILLALFGVGLATFSLMLDFQAIRSATSMNLPEKESWRLAFGLTVTLVWLYLEMLRLFAILAGRRE